MLERLHQLRSRVRALFSRRRLERDLRDELAFHISMREEQLRRQGVDEARTAAVKSFGNPGLLKEQTRDAWTFRMLDQFSRDVRYVLRKLGSSPGFSLTVIVTFAVAIGLNASIFSVVDAVLLRPLPHIQESDRLIRVYQDNLETPEPDFDGISYPDFKELEEGAAVIDGMAAFARFRLPGRIDGPVEGLPVAAVSGAYFEVLEAPIVLGRTFTREDDDRTAAPVAIISHRLWQERFGGTADTPGSRVRVGEMDFTIVGVAPPEFVGALLDWSDLPDIWIPFDFTSLAIGRDLIDRRVPWHMAFARLATGATIDDAREEFQRIATRLAQEFPQSNEGRSITVLGFNDGRFYPGYRASVRRYLLVLLAGGGIVLFTACLNVGNLMLVRATRRQREWAMRRALGAGFRRLIQQQVIEGLLLALAASSIGIWMVQLMPGVLSAFPEPFGIPLFIDPRIDQRLVAYSLVCVVVTTVLFSVFPLLKIRSIKPLSALRTGVSAIRGNRTREVLLGSQVAVSSVLLVVAGLLAQSLDNLRSLDPELDLGGLQQIALEYLGPMDSRGPQEAAAIDRRLRETIRSLPGVNAVATAEYVPLRGFDYPPGPVEVPGSGTEAMAGVAASLVSPGYFSTLGIPMSSGREFDRADEASSVVIVNDVFARRAWGDASPVGRIVQVDDGHNLRVVGVSANTKCIHIVEEPRPCLYRPLSASSQQPVTAILVRTDTPIPLPAARNLVRALDPESDVVTVSSLEARLEEPLAGLRLAVFLTRTLGLSAIFLIGTGVVAMVSFTVAERRRDICIRMALGARARQVETAFLVRLVAIVAAACGAGLALALPVARLVEDQLYGVQPGDAFTYVAVALVLGALSTAAGYFPAHRATRVDPMMILNEE